MGKLKKLRLFKKGSNLRYRVRIDKEYFYKVKDQFPIIRNLTFRDNDVIFETNVNYVDPNITYIDRLKYFVKYQILKNIVALCCLVLVIAVLVSTNKYIHRIVYTGDTKDSLILEEVKRHLVAKGPFLVLSSDIEELSQHLRAKFPHYAWVGLKKTGSQLEIEIMRHDTPVEPNEDLTKTGDLVATSEGVIKKIIVERGVVCVSLNQSVKTGDLLVSGNSNYHKDPMSTDYLVRAKGYIIASCLEFRKINVPLTTIDEVYTGNYQKKWSINWFDDEKSPYPYYQVKSNEVFHIGTFFRLCQKRWYEKQIVTSLHTIDTATEYAKSMIYRDFLKQVVNENERINEITLVSSQVMEDSFELMFIVKSEKNIAAFDEKIKS